MCPPLRQLSKYGMIKALPSYTGNRKEVDQMSYILNFLAAVAANISGYFVCKWIDRLHKGS